MAALRDGFALTKLSGELSLIGVEKGENPYQVIVTSRTGFLNVYQLSDQKLIYSWSLRHGIQITSPTVWCPSQAEYFTVQNKQHVKSWTSNTTNFEKAKKKHLSADIHQIVIQEDFAPVVVCENGRVDFQNNVKDSCATGTLVEGETILWCDSCISNNNLVVILVTESKGNKLQVHCHTYMADAECWGQTTLTLFRPGGQLRCCCLSKKTNPTLLTLWQRGQLIETSLTGSNTTEVGQEVAQITGLTEHCSIVSLDHTHVAVAGIEHDGKVGIGIFNVKFQALHTMRAYPEPVMTKPCLYCHHGHLFLVCSKTLYAFPYECQVSTVARLLGQREVKGSSEVAVNGVVSWATDDKGKKKSKVDKRIEVLFQSLTDTTKKLIRAKFEEDFSMLMNLLTTPSNHHWVTSGQMSMLCRRCFLLKTFWPRGQISQLIDNNFISNSDQPALFECLTLQQEILMIHRAFDAKPDVGESSLVLCLQCYLDMPEEDFTNKCSSIQIAHTVDDEEVKAPLCSAKMVLLNRLLSLPFNDVFLVECLRKLTFKNVLVFLEYLYYLLRVISMATDQSGERDAPTLGKVVDWSSLLIDAHVTQLIVSPDARMLLGNLHEIVMEQVEFCNQLVTLKAVLSQLKKKSAPVTQKKVGSYCIEVLHVH